MKAVTAKILKKELQHISQEELVDLCMRLSRFKKENKELLTYLLFESSDESSYVESIKLDIDELFDSINIKSYFYIKKSLRKIIRLIQKFGRYSSKKETEVELLIYFCYKLKNFKPSIKDDPRLMNIYNKQIATINKKLPDLHEDLQYDLGELLKDAMI